jgi:hypothetical protein
MQKAQLRETGYSDSNADADIDAQFRRHVHPKISINPASLAMDLRDANAPPAETQAHSAKHRGPVDPARMDFSKYHNLDSAHDAREFMSMVAEYMEYLRGDPRDFEGWDSSRELEEMQLAEKFVHMINNTRGWPLARRAAPEFGTPT